MSDKWILVDRVPIAEPDLMKWAHWLEENREARRVARTETKLYLVSTVFLGIDHRFGDAGPPPLPRPSRRGLVGSQRSTEEGDTMTALKRNFMWMMQQKALSWAIWFTPVEDGETLAALSVLLDATERDHQRALKAAKV